MISIMSRPLFHSWLGAMLLTGSVSVQGGEVRKVLVPAPTSSEQAVQVEAEVLTAAFLGVQTDHVPASLAGHLNLPPGFGLMVEEVMPGSPAAKVGLRRFDILLRYQDQQLVNMDQLQVLVRSGRKGEEVRLLVLSQGKERQLTATLDEGPVEISHPRNSAKELRDSASSLLGNGEDWERRQEEWKTRADQFQEQMKAYRQQLENWVKDGSWVKSGSEGP